MSNIGSFMTSAISPDIFYEIKDIFENSPDIFDIKVISIGGRKNYGFICGKISNLGLNESDHLNYETFGHINEVLSRGPNDKINISVHNENGSTVIFKLSYNYQLEYTVYDNDLVGVRTIYD